MADIDREKVINDLQDAVNDDWMWQHADYYAKAMENAIVLLKEQETSNTGKARIFQCEKCGYGFDDIFLTDEHNYDIEPNYCPNCGRLVKWE